MHNKKFVEQIYNQLNYIDTAMFAALLFADPTSFVEVTKPTAGDNVMCYFDDETIHGKVTGVVNGETVKYRIRLINSEDVELSEDDFDVLYDDILPSSPVMFQPKRGFFPNISVDNISKSGFRAFESEQFGIWFGLDIENQDEAEKELDDAIMALWMNQRED